MIKYTVTQQTSRYFSDRHETRGFFGLFSGKTRFLQRKPRAQARWMRFSQVIVYSFDRA